MDIDDTEPPAAPITAETHKNRGGWPKGKPRKPTTPEARAEVAQTMRTRKRKGGTLANPFELPPEMVADLNARGMDVEWKRETVNGAGDPSYDVWMREQGWEPVDSSRFPYFVADGHRGPIRRGGQILMERPKELTEEARLEDRRAAMAQMRIKEEQLGEAPAGTLPRQRANGTSTVSINTTIERGLPIE